MAAASPAIALWLQSCPLAGRLAELESSPMRRAFDNRTRILD